MGERPTSDFDAAPVSQSVLSRRIGESGVRQALLAAGYRDVGADRGQAMATCWRRRQVELWIVPDPATGNRLILCDEDAELPSGLPLMDPAEAAALLTDPDPARRLAGLQAADTSPNAELRVRAAALVLDPEPAVRERAAAIWAGVINELASEDDPIGALFSLPGWRREKLQLLRWWMAESPADPGKVLGAVAHALDESDWEIAVTAMLAAARLTLAVLARDVAGIALPQGPRDGVTRDEARLMMALRDGCLRRLGQAGGKALPPGVAEALGGEPGLLPQRFRHTFAALSSPLPVRESPPETPGIRNSAAGPHLTDGRLLCWVPPGAYRLGEAAPATGTEPNPPRIVTLDKGFFIDAEPQGPATAEEAAEAAVALAREFPHPVRLPTPDMWEMAARGADGRRFPWGMNADPCDGADLSPFGLSELMEGPGEWLRTESCAWLAAGGKHSPPSHYARVGTARLLRFRLAIVL
jgi:hypothetical protein